MIALKLLVPVGEVLSVSCSTSVNKWQPCHNFVIWSHFPFPYPPILPNSFLFPLFFMLVVSFSQIIKTQEMNVSNLRSNVWTALEIEIYLSLIFFLHIRQLVWDPFIALCFALLTIVEKLLVSSYLPNSPNSPHSPTSRGPLHCFVLCLVGDCGKVVSFVIFAKFANVFSFLPFLFLRAFLDISLLVLTSTMCVWTFPKKSLHINCRNSKTRQTAVPEYLKSFFSPVLWGWVIPPHRKTLSHSTCSCSNFAQTQNKLVKRYCAYHRATAANHGNFPTLWEIWRNTFK